VVDIVGEMVQTTLAWHGMARQNGMKRSEGDEVDIAERD
jgi:hypothetical protein